MNCTQWHLGYSTNINRHPEKWKWSVLRFYLISSCIWLQSCLQLPAQFDRNLNLDWKRIACACSVSIQSGVARIRAWEPGPCLNHGVEFATGLDGPAIAASHSPWRATDLAAWWHGVWVVFWEKELCRMWLGHMFPCFLVLPELWQWMFNSIHTRSLRCSSQIHKYY